jgi:hypothetical protein
MKQKREHIISVQTHHTQRITKMLMITIGKKVFLNSAHIHTQRCLRSYPKTKKECLYIAHKPLIHKDTHDPNETKKSVFYIAHKPLLHKITHDHIKNTKRVFVYSAQTSNTQRYSRSKWNNKECFYIARISIHNNKDTHDPMKQKTVFLHSATTKILRIQMKKCFCMARISNRQMHLTMLVGLVINHEWHTRTN